jgi:N-acetylmuramic acid 6-phosphate (MurNAc-6-P) etherase
MDDDNVVKVLIGFNPVPMARAAPLEAWHRTFRDVAAQIEALSRVTRRHFVVNPVVGPEAITGSTRMKGSNNC